MQYVRLFVALLVLGGVWYAALEPHTGANAGKPVWRWGMDFNGGVQLVYELRKDKLASMGLTEEKVAERMEQSRRRLRERIVAFHTQETKVAILGGERILVEVPGVRNIEKVKKEIGRPQYLTVRGVLEQSDQVESGEGWWVLPGHLSNMGKSIKLSEPGVRGEHILFDQLPHVAPVGEGRYGFVLNLNQEGQESCAKFTDRFEQKQICILLDDVPRDVLWVESGGLRNPQITTSTVEDARRLRLLLASGPLPLPFELVQEKTVSPILAASRKTSIQALTAGVVILVLFFGINYLHRPYFLVMAAAAVALEVGLFVWIANLGWVRISLPQLAGLALLIGMSVDAFILVFEHIEREMAQGSGDLVDALVLVNKAFATEIGVIFWAGSTTVLTLAGLFFVEGILGEYFILLALGVGISLSAAVYLRLLMGVGFLARLGHRFSRDTPFAPWLRWIRTIDLLRAAPAMSKAYKVAVPAALLTIAIAYSASLYELGIDFSGGAQIVVQTESQVSSEKIREIAEDLYGVRCEVQYAAEQRQTTVRIPKVIEALASRAEAPKAESDTPRETLLLRRIESDLGSPATLVGVELLGQAAALDNVFSSLKNAAWGLAVLFALCALLYISLTVPFWIVVALTVDVILVMAVVFLTGLPIDYPMIAAFLTFAGYSINDSIVVCHEIRSMGKPHMPEAMQASDPKLEPLIREAIRKGLEPLSSRVFLTSFTTMLTMVPLLFCDGVLRTFGVIFVFGTAAGTLSSIYIVGTHARDVVMGDTQVL